MTSRTFLTPLNAAFVLLIAVATFTGYVLVPAGTQLPIHWGISGAPDAFLPRDAALLVIPAIAIFVLGLLALALRVAGEARREASRYAMATAVTILLALFLTIQTATVMIGTGVAIDMVRIVVFGVGAMFVALGNIMPKTQPNWIAGLRLPWTLRDAANWQATHRLAGVLMMLGGAIVALAALLTGQPGVLLAVTAAGVLLPLIVASVYSYSRSRG